MSTTSMNTEQSTNLSKIIKTGPGENPMVSHYTELLHKVKEAGLLKKTPAFYVLRLLYITVLSLTTWAAAYYLSTLGSWWLLAAIPVMAFQGILAAQYGFIAHEMAHRQVFNSNRLNDELGRILANGMAGLSYGFWMRKHNRHHARPNQIGYDPDIDIEVISFTTESLEEKHGFEKKLSQNQGWLFPILLSMTGFHLLLDSMKSVFNKERPLPRRFYELSMMAVRQVVPIAISVFLFGWLAGLGLWLVMMLSFGVFMGGAFAPNHKGMPLVPKDAKIDFFTRQVLTSRNIRSSWWTDNLMGGLNFQVEHHLFPTMPRPHLAEAHRIVIDYCNEKGVPFVETSLAESYKIIIQYLNKVGLSNNTDPFVCPLVATYRPRN